MTTSLIVPLSVLYHYMHTDIYERFYIILRRIIVFTLFNHLSYKPYSFIFVSLFLLLHRLFMDVYSSLVGYHVRVISQNRL